MASTSSRSFSFAMRTLGQAKPAKLPCKWGALFTVKASRYMGVWGEIKIGRAHV